jgi:hypothetical protein
MSVSAAAARPPPRGSSPRAGVRRNRSVRSTSRGRRGGRSTCVGCVVGRSCNPCGGLHLDGAWVDPIDLWDRTVALSGVRGRGVVFRFRNELALSGATPERVAPHGGAGGGRVRSRGPADAQRSTARGVAGADPRDRAPRAARARADAAKRPGRPRTRPRDRRPGSRQTVVAPSRVPAAVLLAIGSQSLLVAAARRFFPRPPMRP